MTSGNLDWLFLIGGGIAGVSGLVFLARALFRDKSRGRRRCPQCWYDMSGSPGLTCPECGRTAKSETALARTRRRWKLAFVGLLILAAGACIAGYPTYRHDWKKLIPTTALVLLAPAENQSGRASGTPTLVYTVVNGQGGYTFGTPVPSPRGPFAEQMTDELWSRLSPRDIWSWQAQIFFGRYFRNYPVDFSSCVTLPEKWPVGVPIQARIQSILMSSLGRNRAETVAAMGGEELSGSGTLPGVQHPTEQIEIEVRLKGPKSVWHRETVTSDISIRGTVATFLDQVSDQAANDLVREAVAPRLRWEAGKPVLLINDRSATEVWKRITFGIAFQADLLADGEVVASGASSVDWLRPVWKDWEEVPLAWAADGAERSARATELRVIVRGDPAAAGAEYVRNPFGRRPACWAGAFEFEATRER